MSRQPRYKQQPEQQSIVKEDLKNDYYSWIQRGKVQLQRHMGEKLWRMDISKKIEAFINSGNKSIEENLDLYHSRKDIRIFQLQRKVYIEEDVFKYFYPFCLVNTAIATLIIFRHAKSWFRIGVAVTAAVEYVYFLFAFPVEAWHFHKRAISTNQMYSQHLRDSYIERFPESWKSEVYRKVNEKMKEKQVKQIKIIKV